MPRQAVPNLETSSRFVASLLISRGFPRSQCTTKSRRRPLAAESALGLDRVRELHGRGAALDLGLDEGHGGELLVEAGEIAGRGDRLPVHLLDDVAGLQPELLR